jgi:hypothetical protein
VSTPLRKIAGLILECNKGDLTNTISTLEEFCTGLVEEARRNPKATLAELVLTTAERPDVLLLDGSQEDRDSFLNNEGESWDI